MRKINIVRLCILLVIAAAHGLILLITFELKSSEVVSDPPVKIMKLADFDEENPPEIPPQEVPQTYQNTVEPIADIMEETDEVLPEIFISLEPVKSPVVYEREDYLPMHKISVPPVFSEQELRQRLIYPVIALRSGIEGIVYLELFVDKQGDIQNIVIMKEEPGGRGFGEAAVKAFQGFRCTPAQANGVPVAVRYRYPLRFAIR